VTLCFRIFSEKKRPALSCAESASSFPVDFLPSVGSLFIALLLLLVLLVTTMAAVHEERFIPTRHKLDQLSIVKDYAAVPRLEYRYVFWGKCRLSCNCVKKYPLLRNHANSRYAGRDLPAFLELLRQARVL